MLDMLTVWYWALVLMLGCNIGAIAYLMHVVRQLDSVCRKKVRYDKRSLDLPKQA